MDGATNSLAKITTKRLLFKPSISLIVLIVSIYLQLYVVVYMESM